MQASEKPCEREQETAVATNLEIRKKFLEMNRIIFLYQLNWCQRLISVTVFFVSKLESHYRQNLAKISMGEENLSKTWMKLTPEKRAYVSSSKSPRSSFSAVTYMRCTVSLHAAMGIEFYCE